MVRASEEPEKKHWRSTRQMEQAKCALGVPPLSATRGICTAGGGQSKEQPEASLEDSKYGGGGTGAEGRPVSLV